MGKHSEREDAGAVLGVEIERDGERMLIILVWMGKERRRNIEIMNRWIEGKKNSKMNLSGDFNAKIRKDGGGWDKDGKKERNKRNSRNKAKNLERKKLINWIRDKKLKYKRR